MDQGEEQEYKALEETHVVGELGPLPDHLESAFLQDVLAVGSGGGEEPFGDSHGSHRGCPEARQGGCEEEEEVELPRSGSSLVKRQARRAAASRPAPHRERPTISSECGKAFSRSIHLVQHHRLHTGERPFPCGECGKAFSRSSHLTRHRRLHTGHRPHSSAQRGQRFNRSSDRLKHRRVHTGLKPYPCGECGECGKLFIDSSTLTKHQRRHPGQRPFPCPACGKSFGQRCRPPQHRRGHAGLRAQG